MIKNIIKNKNGAVIVFVLFLFSAIMIIIATLMTITRQNYNHIMTQQLNVKSNYLTMGAIDSVIAALLKDDENLRKKLVDISDKITVANDDDAGYTLELSTHGIDPFGKIDYGDDIGKCGIKIYLWRDKDGLWWIRAFIATQIPDYRIDSSTDDYYEIAFYTNSYKGPTYLLCYEFRILLNDLSIHGFDIITEDEALGIGLLKVKN